MFTNYSTNDRLWHDLAIPSGGPRCQFVTQRRHSCIAANNPSFDHLVRAGKQLGRNGEAKGFRGLEINHQLNSCALLDG
jgi:hypothetical protein